MKKTLSFILIFLLCILSGCSIIPETAKTSDETIPEADAKHSNITLINTGTCIGTVIPEESEYHFGDNNHTIYDKDEQEVADITSDMGSAWDGIRNDLKSPDTVRVLMREDKLKSGNQYMMINYNNGEMYDALIKADESTCLWIDSPDKDVLAALLEIITIKTY